MGEHTRLLFVFPLSRSIEAKYLAKLITFSEAHDRNGGHWLLVELRLLRNVLLPYRTIRFDDEKIDFLICVASKS